MNTPNDKLQPAFNGESESIKGRAGGSTPPSSTTHPPSLTPSKRQAEVYGTYTGHGFDHLYVEEERLWNLFCCAIGMYQSCPSTGSLWGSLLAKAYSANSKHTGAQDNLKAAIKNCKEKNNPIRKYLIPICLVSACTSLACFYYLFKGLVILGGAQ